MKINIYILINKLRVGRSDHAPQVEGSSVHGCNILIRELHITMLLDMNIGNCI